MIEYCRDLFICFGISDQLLREMLPRLGEYLSCIMIFCKLMVLNGRATHARYLTVYHFAEDCLSCSCSTLDIDQPRFIDMFLSVLPPTYSFVMVL